MPRNGHVKVEGNREELGSYRYKDADKHWTKYRVNYICQTCKAGMGNETIEVEESHSWSDFDDLGHSGVHSHKYRLICKNCNGTREVSVACNGNATGTHATPW